MGNQEERRYPTSSTGRYGVPPRGSGRRWRPSGDPRPERWDEDYRDEGRTSECVECEGREDEVDGDTEEPGGEKEVGCQEEEEDVPLGDGRVGIRR